MRDGEERVKVCVCARVSDRRGGGGLAAVERERGDAPSPLIGLFVPVEERERVCVSGSVNECSVMMETLRVPKNLENGTKIKKCCKNKQLDSYFSV